MKALTEKLFAFLSGFSFFESKIWGIDVSFILNGAAVLMLLLILYLLMSARIKKASKKISLLEHKLEDYMDDVNRRIESIRIEFMKPPSKPKKPEMLIEEMLGDEVSKEPSAPKPLAKSQGKEDAQSFFETPDTAVESEEELKAAVQKGNAKNKDEARKAPPQKGKTRSIDISGEIDALLNGAGDKIPEKQVKEASPLVDDLLKGLDDASNPFIKKASVGAKDSAALDEIGPDSLKVQPTVTIESQKDQGSWEDKTLLKDEAQEISAVKLDESELFEGEIAQGDADFPLSVQTEAVMDSMKDRTSIDPIDRSIEFGSEEISLDLGDLEEPEKSLDASGRIEEKRSSQRISQGDIDLEVVYEGFTDFITECSVNISKGGMFIRLPKIHPVGSMIKLDVRLRDGYRLIKAQGEVVRVEPASSNDPKAMQGMGIKFISLDGESEKLIDRIVQQRNG